MTKQQVIERLRQMVKFKKRHTFNSDDASLILSLLDERGEAVRFAVWIAKNRWNYLRDMGKEWWSKQNGMASETHLTIEQVYELFKMRTNEEM